MNGRSLIRASSAISTVVGMLLASVSALAQVPAARSPAGPPPCPSISDQHRWLDNNSCLSENAFPKRLRVDGLDLSLGGEARARFETTNALDFGLRDGRGEDALLLRGLVHADLRIGDFLRGFVQLGFTDASGRRGGPAPVDESGLDIQQAFVDLGAPVGGGRATLRAGRQELAFGTARLVGTREGPNLRLAFDGFRTTWRKGDLSVDAIAVRPVSSRPDDFDDERDRAQALYGVYVATAPPTGIGLDLYYLGFENDRARFDSGPGRERRHSVGARAFGNRSGWSWDVEGVYQFGDYGARRIEA